MGRNGRSRFQFAIDLHSGVPVYRQLIDQVRGGIASGALASGDQLPTVRQLAVDLQINPIDRGEISESPRQADCLNGQAHRREFG